MVLHCRICSVQKVMLRKVDIEPGIKVECLPEISMGDI